MAASQKADQSEHTGEPNKEMEQPSQAGASVDSVDPGASRSNAPTASADGNSGDDATNAVSASTSTIDGAGDAGNSETVKESYAENSKTVEEMITDALLTVGEMASEEDSQRERETASVDGSQMERETASVDDSQMERETASVDASQTEGETDSVDASQMEGETTNVDASQTEGETASVDASPTEREAASVDASQTEREAASVDASQTEREAASVDASQTEREAASVDASPTEREAASVDASQTEREAASVDASQTEREAASVDASQTEREAASVDASQTEREAASVDASQTEREAASVDASQTEREAASVDASQTEREAASVDASPTEREAASVDASPTEREAASVDASPTEREAASVDASQTEREAASVDASQKEREAASVDASTTERGEASVDASPTERGEASVDASPTERGEASVDASPTEREAASVDASPTEREAASLDASQTEREAASLDASQTEREAASVDASQTEREAASVDASQTEREAASVDASQTEREAASVDASQTEREAASVDASQTEREAASVDASQTEREAASVDASQKEREAASVDASETASADGSQTERETASADAAPQTVEETGNTNASQTNGETDSTDIPLDMGVVDADDEMEVNAIKVEDEQMQEEHNLEGMPVITAVEEGSDMDAFSSNSLDHGDEVEKMDTGTDGLTEKQIEKTGQVDNTDSMPSIVDTEDTEQPAEQTSFEEASGSSPPMEEDNSEDVKPFHPSPTSSEAILPQNSKGSDSPAGLENGVTGQPVKVVDSAQPTAEPVSTSVDTLSMVNVKDEPVDEEYDQALAPVVLTEGVKDEPDAEELKISNVFSVGGAPTPIAASTPVTALSKTVMPPLTPAASSIPPLMPMAMRVACSACNKVLLKGQTAYQRKGSSDLFCSTSCLTTYSPPSVVKTTATCPAKKPCHYCLKEIANPKDVITAPVDTMGTVKDFCSQTCLSSFNFKRNSAVSTLSSSLSTITGAVKCSMCKKACISKHEVIFQGSMHRLCSEVCFTRFRSTNKLSMNSCQSCNNYCYGKVTVLVVQGVNKTFCSAGCVTTFKQKAKKTVACTMCRNFRAPVEMVDSADSDGKLEMFCSTGCVTAHKVQTVSSSGAQVECNTCGQKTVPSFHLAMSDGSIRNFCTMNCVVTFQDQFNKSNSQSQMNVTPSTGTTAPPAAPGQTMDRGSQGTRLPCFQCHRLFSSKPELIQFKDKVVFLCSVNCSEEYRKINYEMARCEYCKIEKPAKEVKRINNRDYTFCSEGCKLLYKHDLTKRWGKHCRTCAYCASTAQEAVTGQYGGKMEEFCSDECKSHYTLLFCQVAKCDACERQGKLIETLPMLGEVKHFCNLQCLLDFCSLQTQNQGKPQGQKVAISIAQSPSNTTTATSMSDPVIANVVSLASSPIGQPNYTTALQGTVPRRHVKYVGNASTQTQAPRAPPPKVQKNKALLCKPMVQNKGIMCKPNLTTSGCQTDDNFPKVIIVPIPVPVYVPVPMNLYTQYTPQPVGLPIPLPVPMFLPVTLDNAERIVQTIQDIKEKIPSDPFEADLILMAEMVAEEGMEKSPQRPPERPAPAVQDDQGSTYSGDLDTEELSNFLTSWHDEPPPTPGVSSRHSRPYAHETLRPILDINTPTTPSPPIMDIEADFPVQTLELMAHWRDQERDRSPSPPPSPPRRRARRKARDGLPQKKKRRKSKAAETASVVASLGEAHSDVVPGEPPKLQHMYGVDAWKRWVQWSKTQPDLEKPRFGSRPMEIKEDVLKCTTAELSYGLCRFICEVQRPNGESYSQDSLFYLCLGIQQYLFQNGRMENIFTDLFYGKFTLEITKLLKGFKPTITASGYLHSRVEEEYLWDCKQLGAYSPIVLLNTLLFFCTKFFQFKTVAQHRQLSFAHVMRCTKSIHDNTKSNFLRFYPPIPKKDVATETAADVDGVAAKRKRDDEEKEEVLEMMENSENPLRCPVRLYEFYLSKCSDSVKQRTNVFFLLPERSCVPNSPMWFSSQGLDDHTLDTMLTRILTVREIHLGDPQRNKPQSKDPEWVPDQHDDNSD
ncbi:zinc finger MYM-type protein 4-like [Salvelinus namaycush]|uniref:Zinc finger MYM-type protein 4-like n=1 Tax=Salvelinus namaycush TaxID=8040 RepID=A0A8U0PNH9_SALNM|nr:zinc finger MYM-type protein 4-like [Salvelinus namaycush]